MKRIRWKNLLYATPLVTVLFSAGTTSAQTLRVDSVSVDSVWNSDSSWYDGNGILQQRTSRDCKVSFIPQGEGMARIFITLSIDSGKTWAPLPDLLTVLNNALSITFMTGQKAVIIARVLGGDRTDVAFKMTARQAAPIIIGNPRTIIVDTFGQNINIVLNLKLASATSPDGFCTLSMVYWDTLDDGIIDDSTTGVNALTWKWLTQLSSTTQTKVVIARAKDKNGLWSAPETLKVNPLSLDTTGRAVMFTEGFEGTLSNWSINYLLNLTDPRFPRMAITTAAAHGGMHAITTDSNRTALMMIIDSTAAFPKMKRIESGVAGVEFYFMAQSAGGINFTIEIGRNAGSSGGLGYSYGIGFDPSDKLKCTYSDLYNDVRKDSLCTTLVPGHWYKGAIEVSFTAKTIKYYIDGVQKWSIPLPSGLMGIDRVLIFRGMDGSEGSKQYYADDITLYTK